MRSVNFTSVNTSFMMTSVAADPMHVVLVGLSDHNALRSYWLVCDHIALRSYWLVCAYLLIL